MTKVSLYLFLLVLICLNMQTYSQAKEAGPIIKEFGKVFTVENTDFKIDKSKEYKAVFDIMGSPEGHDQINAAIETAARFLNMHAQQGIPAEQLNVALVFHNQASKDVISNAAYNKR